MALSVSIELVSSSARVTSVKSYTTSCSLFVCDGHPDPKIGPQVYLGPIKIKIENDLLDLKNPYASRYYIFDPNIHYVTLVVQTISVM